MSLREAAAVDAPALARIQVRCWHHAFGDVVFPENTPTVEDQTDVWVRMTATPGVTVLASEVGGAVRGFVAFGPALDEDAAGAGEVYAFYVDPTAQGAGLGDALLTAAERHLAAEGRSEAVLWTLEAALARSFYEARGWVLDRPAEPGHGVLEVSEVRYRRSL